MDNNYVETVIALAPNLFFGTSIAVNILVLSKHKTDTSVQFIDAGNLFDKKVNNNELSDRHIEQIIKIFDEKLNLEHFSASVSQENIVFNAYNLSVSSYVEVKSNRDAVDIKQLNAEIKRIADKITKLRTELDAIVSNIEERGVKHEFYR